MADAANCLLIEPMRSASPALPRVFSRRWRAHRRARRQAGRPCTTAMDALGAPVDWSASVTAASDASDVSAVARKVSWA